MSRIGDSFNVGGETYVIDHVCKMHLVGHAGSSSLFPSTPELMRLRFESNLIQRTLGEVKCEEFEPGDPITLTYIRVVGWPKPDGVTKHHSMDLILNVQIRKGEYYD